MSDKSQAHDKQVLHKMGYAQELSRRMSGFSNFAISFSIICILAGGISAFPAAFNALGSGGAVMIWLVGGFLAMTVAWGMGQIASSFPTAGGLYHWSSHLGGKFWGWATAWLNLVGLVCVVSSVDVLLYAVFFKGLFMQTAIGGNLWMNNWTISITKDVTLDMWQMVFLIIVMSSQALLNHYGIELTTKLTDFSGYFIFVVTVILIIVLFAFSPVALDFSRLWSFQNVTGDAGGGVVPFHTSSIAFAFLLGLSYVCYTITGFDASAHTSEETQDAQVNVPKGMWTAVFWSWVFGFVAVAAYVLTMPSLEEAHAAGWNSFFYMWGASLMPHWMSIFLAGCLVVSNYLCALAGMTSCSRMMYAFSRDGGIPFVSETLSHVSTQYRTPTYAIWVSAALALLSTVYAPAYLVLAVACAVFLYLSYVMPVLAGMIAEGTEKWREKGPYNLGALSKPNAIIAVIVGILLAISGFFPPNEKVFYFTLIFAVALLTFWSKKYAVYGIIVALGGYGASFLPISETSNLHFLVPPTGTAITAIIVGVIGTALSFLRGGEDARFEGVPEGQRIVDRQKMIAEIEKKFGEQ